MARDVAINATTVPPSASSSSLWNKDLAPIPLNHRTWGTYNYAALWVAMSVNIPTYLMASAMVAGGMNWKQALFTVFLGNLIVLIPMLLNAHAGAEYGIPFPVFARASFGVLGANIPAVLRALVACGCFGIQTWIGGEAINTLLGALILGLAMLGWAFTKAGGLGPMLSTPSQFHTFSEFFAFFVPSLTGVVAFWATVALNIPDFTRYAKGQREQMLGQA